MLCLCVFAYLAYRQQLSSHHHCFYSLFVNNLLNNNSNNKIVINFHIFPVGREIFHHFVNFAFLLQIIVVGFVGVKKSTDIMITNLEKKKNPL